MSGRANPDNSGPRQASTNARTLLGLLERSERRVRAELCATDYGYLRDHRRKPSGKLE